MFRPNQNCTIYSATGKTDVYGTPAPAQLVKERCFVVKLDIANEKSAVRADTSASRGNARELEAKAEILLQPTTIAHIDDLIEVSGVKLRIMSKFPRRNMQGVLDHYQISCTYWSEV